jgi:hypothetical protein
MQVTFLPVKMLFFLLVQVVKPIHAKNCDKAPSKKLGRVATAFFSPQRNWEELPQRFLNIFSPQGSWHKRSSFLSLND